MTKAAKTYLACCGSNRHSLYAACCCNSKETGQIATLGKRIAWAQDVYPDERVSHMAELRRMGVLLGEFPTWKEAFAAASAALEAKAPRRKGAAP